jgi:hypothetical protein
LIIYGFTSRSIWRRQHCRWRAAKFRTCSVLRAFEQGGIFIVSHLLWHGVSVFPVSSEGPPHSVASYNTQGVWRIYSDPDPHGANIIDRWPPSSWWLYLATENITWRRLISIWDIPWFVISYYFYPTSFVFSIPKPSHEPQYHKSSDLHECFLI